MLRLLLQTYTQFISTRSASPCTRHGFRNLPNALFTTHRQSSSSAPPPTKRARNLSSRYDPTLHHPTPTTPLNYTPPLSQSTTSAKSAGLSPQGLANPKTVIAAAKLAGSVADPSKGRSLRVGNIDVYIPAKPSPPGPEECCMSGCAVCVHDIYVDTLSDYRHALLDVRDTLVRNSIGKSLWPKEVSDADDRDKPKDGNATPVDDDIDPNLDPTMKAFLAMEKALKQKKDPIAL
ncbi:hypothetical protein FRB99_007858 [Tulasnella sp. 403]|nr:hypothetical protein FRB99_007858 [Tulasnella sp. 403]